MTLAAVNTPEAVEPAGRRTVANIIVEIESQRAGYLAAMRGHEAETRILIGKMSALDRLLDSPAVTSRATPGKS